GCGGVSGVGFGSTIVVAPIITCSTVMAASYTDTDNFNRADADTLGAPWVEYSLAATPRGFLHIVSNQLRFTSAFPVAVQSPRVDRWDGTGIPSTTTHQKSKVTISALVNILAGGNNQISICVR